MFTLCIRIPYMRGTVGILVPASSVISHACFIHPPWNSPVPTTMTYVLKTDSSWCLPPAPSLGWCRLSFPAAWLWGPWYSLEHCSQWPKPPGTTLFLQLTVDHRHRQWFYGSIALCPLSARYLWDFYDDWKEFGKGFHGSMSLQPSSTAEGLQTLPFELSLYVINHLGQFVLSFILKIQ